MIERAKIHENMKIYRPGMLQVGNYDRIQRRITPEPIPTRKHHKHPFMMSLLFLAIAAGVIIHFTGVGKTVPYKSTSSRIINSASLNSIGQAECSSNSLSKEIVVSLSAQHLWACDLSHMVYASAVVTGYTGNPSNITPVGTYHIFDKLKNLNLTGKDDMGSWDDHVTYWLGFLTNKYGQFGLHDATWRKPAQFGHINTATTNASHGCVELPVATASWLYGWAPVGTQLIIKV